MDISRFKTVCVAGFGKSGAALARLLGTLGKRVKVTDERELSSFPRMLVQRMSKEGVLFELGGHTEQFIASSDLIVTSPGIDPRRSAVYTWARKHSILCVGELEFSSWLTPAKIVAITGTNGKTTTTFLTYKVLKMVRKGVHLAGNIGIPLARCALKAKKSDIIVCEVSSFQLETTLEFRPFVACILNIEPDHLDRYSSFDEYVGAKMNIFRNQKKDDWAVLNKKQAPLMKRHEDRIRSRIKYFSDECGNENYSAVYRMTSVLGAGKADCLKVFSRFKGLPHRLEHVKTLKGVIFINDSKATNPSATVWALRTISKPVILIAGGKDKGVDYVQIKPYLKRVKRINLFGEAAEKIKKALGAEKDISLYRSLKEVVRASYAGAGEKEVVLFSPMCSSFDMFSNYKERGKEFIREVNSLSV